MTRDLPAQGLADLGETITQINAQAQSGFGAIASMARRALAGLEASDGTYPSPEALAAVLGSIRCKAELFSNDINVTAAEAGCNWTRKH